MAFDEGLAERIRRLIGPDPTQSERKMFGGLCFMSGGNMSFGIRASETMVGVGSDAYAAALQLPHARAMDFTGRSMRGLVYVDPDGISEADQLAAWIQRGLTFAQSRPPKRPSGGLNR